MCSKRPDGKGAKRLDLEQIPTVSSLYGFRDMEKVILREKSAKNDLDVMRVSDKVMTLKLEVEGVMLIMALR